MQKRFNLFAPHHYILLGFYLLTVFYFYPAYSGKVLQQSDVSQWEGSAREVMEYKKKTGEDALWTNSMFCGMPTYQITGTGTTNYMDYLKQPRLPYPSDQLFLLLIGGYILLLTFRINPWVAAIGAVGLAFTSYNFIFMEAGHSTKVYAIAYIPFVMAGFNLLFRGKYLYGAALAAVGVGMQVGANHLQMTYYMFLCIGVWALFELIAAIRNGQIKTYVLGVLIAAAACGAGLATSATNIMMTEEYARETIRGGSELKKDPEGKPKPDEGRTDGLDRKYALDWSQGWSELFTVLMPNAVGSGSGTDIGKREVYKAIQGQANKKEAERFVSFFPYAYWGALPFTSGPWYFGAIIVFLFVTGIIVLKGPVKWWLITASILSLLLSLGENFPALSYFFFDYFPFYNKFRSVNNIMVIAQICFPIMAALTIHKLFFTEMTKKEIQKVLKLAVYITGGLCLVFAVLGGAFFDYSAKSDENLGNMAPLLDKIKSDRQSIQQMDAFRSLILILLSAAAIWFYAAGKLKKNYALIAVGGLILIDLWLVDHRYLNSDSFESKKDSGKKWTPSEADQAIMSDTTLHFRVFNVMGSPFMDGRTSYYHKSIGGYHAAKLRRYQDLIQYQIGPNNKRVIDMLNTKYFISPDQSNNSPVATLNPYALGNAWFVEDISLVKDPDTEMDSLRTFSPADKAIVDETKFGAYIKGFDPKRDSSGTIKLVTYAPHRLKYISEAGSEQLAVFSEVFYDKGWQAYVDGTPVDHIRVNYVLRAMRVPAGRHEIEFKFDPPTLKKGETISLAGNVLVYGLGITALVVFFIRRSRQKETEPQA